MTTILQSDTNTFPSFLSGLFLLPRLPLVLSSYSLLFCVFLFFILFFPLFLPKFSPFTHPHFLPSSLSLLPTFLNLFSVLFHLLLIFYFPYFYPIFSFLYPFVFSFVLPSFNSPFLSFHSFCLLFFSLHLFVSKLIHLFPPCHSFFSFPYIHLCKSTFPLYIQWLYLNIYTVYIYIYKSTYKLNGTLRSWPCLICVWTWTGHTHTHTP